MDCRDSSDEAAFRAEVRSWLEANTSRVTRRDVPPPPFSAVGTNDDLQAAKKFQAQLADARLAALTWPREYGGRGAGPVEEAIFDQEAQGYDVPTWTFVINLRLAGPTMIVHGSRRRRPASCRRCCGVRRSGASSSANGSGQ